MVTVNHNRLTRNSDEGTRSQRFTIPLRSPQTQSGFRGPRILLFVGLARANSGTPRCQSSRIMYSWRSHASGGGHLRVIDTPKNLRAEIQRPFDGKVGAN